MQSLPDSVARLTKTRLAKGWAVSKFLRSTAASSPRRRLAALGCSLLLTACGQKGPLTLPIPPSPPGAAAPAPAASAASAPAARIIR